MSKKFLIPAFLVAALLIGGCATAFSLSRIASEVAKNQPEPVVRQATAVTQPSAETERLREPSGAPVVSESAVLALEGTFEQIYEQVSPSVVSIQVTAGRIGRSPISPILSGQGSGFVWDTDGHIVTNNHVVDGANQITVVFWDGSMAEAELVGSDPNADLAVVKVDPDDVTELRPVQLGDSSQVKVGQIAIAIGNPYGLANTMTEGIISALSRSLPVGEESPFGGTYTIPDIIQTDAAINPGNSGGVLLNVQGEVIGVPTAIRSMSNSNSGVGFVIPSNIVRRVVPALIEDGRYEHPRMGISGTTLTPALAEELGLDRNLKGVLVSSVVPNSPAEEAGLQGITVSRSNGREVETPGDIIIAIDDVPVTKFEDLTSYLFNHTQVGQTVTLTIIRQGREMTVPLTLGVLR